MKDATTENVYYQIAVNHPVKGWINMRVKYRNKEIAKSWLSFVRNYWAGLPTKVVRVQKS